MVNVEETIKWFEFIRLIVHKESETALSVNGLTSIDKICDDAISLCLKDKIIEENEKHYYKFGYRNGGYIIDKL